MLVAPLVNRPCANVTGHFDDLAGLVLRAGREAIEELYEAQLALAQARVDYGPESVRDALEAAVG